MGEGGGRIRVVADQRVEVRAALGGKHRGDRATVGGVGAEAVHGLGAERHEPARPQQRGGPRNAGRIGRKSFGASDIHRAGS